MQKIKLEGELKEEIKKQIDNINAFDSEIRALSVSKYQVERKMWDHLRAEFPDQSDNCTLENKDGDFIFIDRLKNSDL